MLLRPKLGVVGFRPKAVGVVLARPSVEEPRGVVIAGTGGCECMTETGIDIVEDVTETGIDIVEGVAGTGIVEGVAGMGGCVVDGIAVCCVVDGIAVSDGSQPRQPPHCGAVT